MKKDYLREIQEEFMNIVREKNLLEEGISISSRALTPKEAIGEPGRDDFPIQKGKEKLMQATFGHSHGQAFTDMPRFYQGKLKDLATMPLVNNGDRGIFISGMNAVLKELNMAEGTVHCKDQEPGECCRELAAEIAQKYGRPQIALFGLQPAMAEALAEKFTLRIFDLDADNIGQKKFGVLIEDGECDLHKVEDWADVFLVTGSTLCNNSLEPFLNIKKPVIFFGTTIAGTAKLKNLSWFCPKSS